MKITEKDGGISFGVCVVPRASKTEIVGEHYGSLKIRIASAPVDGAANAELIKFLAKKFGVKKADIGIISGETSKNKRIKISNLSESSFRELIK